MQATSRYCAVCLFVLAGTFFGCAQKPAVFEQKPCPPLNAEQIEQMKSLEKTDLEVWLSEMLHYCEGVEKGME